MSSRLLVVLITLGVLATGGGVAGGLLLARDPGAEAAVAGPTTIPETTERRLVRRVVLEVRALTLDIPNGTGGIATGFRGTTFTPLGPGLDGPTATAAPFAFGSSVLAAGERSGPLALHFIHEVQPNPPRTRVVNLAIPFPQQGRATLYRDVSAIGVTAHLRLRVTVTES